MDQSIRNKLRSVVTQCRRLLEESIAQQLQGKYDIYATGKKDEVRAEKDVPVEHLSEEEREARRDILAHFEHIEALGFKPRESLEQLIREIAFTHLNRLCAYKMMEVRDVYVGGQKFREAVSKGLKSQGFLFYRAEQPEEERLFQSGQQEEVYRHFLNWLGGTLSQEIGVLFSPTDPANRVYPPQRVLDEVLDLLNSEELKGVWAEDETIGWVYQYFTPKELRDQARKESQAPRNSYELAFRNQFFTPRYVVEFLTDNTLGRIWYEMQRGKTRLKDECLYMVRRPGEVFFTEKFDEPDSSVKAMKDLLLGGTEETFPPFQVGETERLVKLAHTVDGYERHPSEDQVEGEWWPWVKLREIGEAKDLSRFLAQDLLDVLFCQARADRYGGGYGDWDRIFYDIANEVRRRAIVGRKDDAAQEHLLTAITEIPDRAKKDPREVKILDPACGSGHFLLYCFALLLVIYEEAYDDNYLGPKLQADYPTKDDLRKALPGLILRHNLHGIDIDVRCTQIAALALWLRCQRAYQEMGLKRDRPKITRSNIVCVEPMPGERGLMDDFLKTLRDDRLEALIGRIMNVPEGRRVRATEAMAESLCDLVRLVWEKMQLAGDAGSLLKIEEEIQWAIRRGQREWEEKQPLFRITDYGLTEQAKESYVRFVPGEGLTFWERAEALVTAALEDFAAFASNGKAFQRKLFVDDAVRGLAFVDLARVRFDVTLMNPPFGAPALGAAEYIRQAYPIGYVDLYSSFIDRAVERSTGNGVVGAITSRTGFFMKSFEAWRRRSLLGHSFLDLSAHLGQGVLDSAMVETVAYTIRRAGSPGYVTSFDLIGQTQRAELLLQLVGEPDHRVERRSHSQFLQMPAASLANSMPSELESDFSLIPPLSKQVEICRGGGTSDDERFVRAAWEVAPRGMVPNKKRRWRRLSKGGEFGAFYSPVHLLLDWRDEGGYLGQIMYEKRPREGFRWGPKSGSRKFMGRPGIVWPLRSQKGLSFRILPSDCVFSHKSPVVMSGDATTDLALAAILNSKRVQDLADCLTTFGSYEMGVVGSVPIDLRNKKIFADLGLQGFTETREAFLLSETDPNHKVLSRRDISSLGGHINHYLDLIKSADALLQGLISDINGLYGEANGKCDERHIGTFEDLASSINVDALFSEFLGFVFGRWDIRHAQSIENSPQLPEPFDPLPICSPGTLQGPDGLPAIETPEGYPLGIDWDGILVDDPDHPDDIIRRGRDVLEVIWKDRAESIEKEACEILGVADLRDYFRKPGAGGFWDDHIKRYSKSRRKAPIYWLLQSSKKSYALWIYYHRLDKDILFKALLNFVEPKIRREEARLDELRSQKIALGPDAKGAKKFDKEIDRQEALLSELRDFDDKLRRAANLHIDPDLDDGVVLNIAPLRELVPWKEAKSTWDDLMDGKYEWSSIGQQLREKGLVK